MGMLITYKGKPAKIVGIKRSPLLTEIYAYAMQTPLREVRSLGVWRPFRLWHRLVHRCKTSSALAECVGSLIRYIEKKDKCWRPSPKCYTVHPSCKIACRKDFRGRGRRWSIEQSIESPFQLYISRRLAFQQNQKV